MKKIILLAGLIFVLVSFNFVFADSVCGELKKQINQLTSQAQSCNKDSDCVFDNNFLSCQNVCGIPRNKNTNISELKEITSKFDKDCAKAGCPGYGCLNDYLVKCVGGKCQKALNESCVCTQDAKICPDGSAVSRVCPDCEFALCENKGCDYSSKTKTYLYKDRACLVVDYACVEGEPFTDNCGCGCEKNPKVKVFPETASLRARERLGELGFNISLKEVGKGNNTKMVYEISGKKQGKMFGLFKIKGKVSAEVDAETGEIIGIKKPWWAFLASGI